MHSNGVGTRVADLYIAWAHHYNIVANFERAEQIFQLAIQTNARPFDYLTEYHTSFGVMMSKRILNHKNAEFEANARMMLCQQFSKFTRLSLDVPKKQPKFPLQQFQRAEYYAIPFNKPENVVQPSTPERQSTAKLQCTQETSKIASFIASCGGQSLEF